MQLLAFRKRLMYVEKRKENEHNGDEKHMRKNSGRAA